MNRIILTIYIFSLFITFSLSNFNANLKDENDFKNISINQKKYGFKEKTIHTMWKNSFNKNLEPFNNLQKLSAIKFDDIKFNKGKKSVNIGGNVYYYSDIIFSNAKNINSNELIDIYLLFDLICAIKKQDEITISSSFFRQLPSKSTVPVLIDYNNLPDDWKIPKYSDPSMMVSQQSKELNNYQKFNQIIHWTSPNQALFFTDNKYVKILMPITLSVFSYSFINKANGWANYSNDLQNSGETNILQKQQSAMSNHDVAINLALGFGIASIYSLYDWIVNIND